MQECRTCPYPPVQQAPGGRSFNLTEANHALVLVKRVVADLVSLHARLTDVQEMVEVAEADGTDEQWADARDQLLDVARQLRVCLEELEDIGVEFKDWSNGLVDFPCVLDGREVRLCWRLGENVVSHWHEVGASVRLPIETPTTTRSAPASVIHE